MVLQVISQMLLLHLIATTTSQYMPSQYPYYHHGPQMAMMPNGQQMMPNGHQMMPNGEQMMSIPMQMPNGGQIMQMPNAPPMLPHMPRLPGMPPPPMHLPMPLPMNGGRLPMVVMPHYSKKADKHRRKPRKPKRKRINMDSSSSEDSCSQSEHDYHKKNLRTPKKRRGVLTPVVSYVTKEGYVVYQKKIKKDKARDWLELSKDDSKEFKENIRIESRNH